MSTDLVYPEKIDALFGWSVGTAARLARRGKLPYYLLPDGSIRIRREEVEALVRHVQPQEGRAPCKA